jgi:hypothetical protein
MPDRTPAQAMGEALERTLNGSKDLGQAVTDAGVELAVLQLAASIGGERAVKGTIAAVKSGRIQRGDDLKAHAAELGFYIGAITALHYRARPPAHDADAIAVDVSGDGDGTIGIRPASAHEGRCASCRGRPPFVTVSLTGDGGGMSVGLCGQCFAGALAIALGRAHVDAGGSVGDLVYTDRPDLDRDDPAYDPQTPPEPEL